MSEGDRRTIEQLSSERNQVRWALEATRQTITSVLALPENQVGEQARALLQTQLDDLNRL
ncbi:hypothetical protein [Angustibacter luteus]|uniref:Uncharacterized protein n=1 Tax=Angustibacter luteus TaxID=658456 RepID=A0ABW1JEE7_9ACTN